jgi:hypothetical protein
MIGTYLMFILHFYVIIDFVIKFYRIVNFIIYFNINLYIFN